MHYGIVVLLLLLLFFFFSWVIVNSLPKLLISGSNDCYVVVVVVVVVVTFRNFQVQHQVRINAIQMFLFSFLTSGNFIIITRLMRGLLFF